MREPIYDHDCTNCRYLGTTGPAPGTVADRGIKANAIDHYACVSPRGEITLLQRYGSEGSRYSSTPNECASSAYRVTRTLMDERYAE